MTRNQNPFQNYFHGRSLWHKEKKIINYLLIWSPNKFKTTSLLPWLHSIGHPMIIQLNGSKDTEKKASWHPQLLSILFIPGRWGRWDLCFSSMAMARWWQNPTNNPSSKNTNKSNSNNGKKKAKEREQRETRHRRRRHHAELDGPTMSSYVGFGGFWFGNWVGELLCLWCETVLQINLCFVFLHVRNGVIFGSFL